jgi:GntR family transcriptional regulator/GntR family frlABCD operon transcriptional regulator
MQNLPQYKKLYELLRKQIREGKFREGDLLPSENELCSLHEVTRPTVRQALDRLVIEGFIKKHKGKGSIVNSLPKGIGILSLEGTSKSMGQDLVTHIVEKPAMKAWPEPFMFELEEEEQENGCIILQRQRIIDDEVVLFEVTYLPALHFPRFTNRSFENKSLFDILRQVYQTEITGGEQKFWAIPANKSISENLHVKKGKPVLHLQRKMHTNKTSVNIYSSIFCNTEHFYLQGLF